MPDNSNSSKRVDDSSYNAEYPYNQVTEWPSGHQVQMDNTPGHERIFIQHASGTYTEISATGKQVNFTVGDLKSYGKGGATFTVDECGDVKFSGHTRFLVAGGAHIEVAGDAGVFAGGDMAAAVMGKLNARSSSVYVGTDGDLNMNVGGQMNVEAKGDIVMKGANIKLN